MTTVRALTPGPTTVGETTTVHAAAALGRPPLRLVEPGAPRVRTARPKAPSRRSADEDLSGGVKSVVAALDVLDCFAETDELGVSDIARRLGVAKSTAHRLLTSLCARGLAERIQALEGRAEMAESNLRTLLAAAKVKDVPSDARVSDTEMEAILGVLKGADSPEGDEA